MSDKVRSALEQLQAAREGQRRTDQYVVQEQASILREVTEEEYQAVLKERREEFVVGERKLGYEDQGKEIWEDPDALREHQQEAMRRPAPRPQAPKAAHAQQLVPPTDPEEGHASLLQSFQAGARTGGSFAAVGSSVPPVQDAHRQRELDSMLEMMCSQIDSSEVPKPRPPATPAGPVKRKLEDTQGSEATSKKSAQAQLPPVPVKREVEATQPMVTVKSEPPETQPAATVMAIDEEEDVSMAVKEEVDSPPRTNSLATASPVKQEAVCVKEEVESPPTVKKEPKIKVELSSSTPVKKEVPEGSGAALQEWLQGGSCEGVKVELETDATSGVAPKFNLPLEEDGGLWFFFVDAFEEERASPPRVYLFGKVLAASPGGQNRYESCCIVVEGIERKLHLLLNLADLDDTAAAESVAKEAEAEFDDFCRKNCPGVRKLRANLKWRNYAFEKALPQGAGYLPFLKVSCDSTGSMPQGMTGSAFSHVFGLNTPLLERLLLSCRITGPSWIRLQPGSWREEAAKLSFCSVELRISPKSIYVPKKDHERRQLSELGMPSTSPPLRVLSVSMQTFQKSAQEPHEPVAIACTLHPNVSVEATDSDRDLKLGMDTWAALRRFDSRPLPRDSDRVLSQRKVQQHSSEVALLTAFLGLIQTFDPDVICGYSAYAFDLDVLAARMQQLRLQSWQKLGRLRRPKERLPRMENRQGAGFWVGSNLTAGRLVCDVLLQARDLLPKLGAYDLPTLALHQLNERTLQTIEPENLPQCFSTAQALGEMAHMTLHSALCGVKLMHSLQILPLTRQLTNLAGNLWNSSLQNKRAERNEMLLCHEFHRNKFILPDRESMAMRKRRQQMDAGAFGTTLDDPEGNEQEQGPAASGRRGKAAYSGGLVLEPKVGLYDEFVMLLDFNSLYPSIIQEHNICFTTVERPDETQVPKCATEADLLAKTHPADGTEAEGVLPQVLRKLVESRREVKSAMKSERNPQKLQTLEIRQKALKLTANSMYGCLGFQNSRFYAKPLAALITAKGREALQTTISVVQQELQLDVVYGDTDSVFVNTKTADHAQALQAAQQIKRSVNKRYKRLEIEIDAVFVRLMLLKKKKYAAIKVVDWAKQTFEREFKGLDIVRRDWCGLAKDIGEQVLTKVLEEGKEDSVHWVHNFLTERAQEMDEKKVALERYVITKGLTKAPKDYPDIKNQPHVQVALRLMERGKPVRPGQEIAYVICEVAGEGAKTSLAERARHPYEFSLDPSLRVDVAWYKKQQVHPLVTRLLAPVESTDPARIAECLGMDAARYAQAAAAQAAAADVGEVDAAYVSAVNADVTALFDRKARMQDFQSKLPGIPCRKCENVITWKQLLQPQSWEAEGVNVLFRCNECKEPVNPRFAQNLLTMQLRKVLKDHCEGWVQCPDENCIEKTRRANGGQNLTSERSVLRELEYIQYLCGSEGTYVGQDKRGCREAAKGMAKTTSWLLDCNGYNWVDCSDLFGSIFGRSGREREAEHQLVKLQ